MFQLLGFYCYHISCNPSVSSLDYKVLKIKCNEFSRHFFFTAKWAFLFGSNKAMPSDYSET